MREFDAETRANARADLDAQVRTSHSFLDELRQVAARTEARKRSTPTPEALRQLNGKMK